MKRLLALALLAVLAGCQPVEQVGLAPLPAIDLERFEPGLRQRLDSALAALTDPQAADDADHWTSTGMLLQAHGIDDAARVCYENANALAPGFLNTYLIAYLAQQDGDLETAIAGYREAAKLNTATVAPALRLGEIYLQQGALDEARQMFEAARRANAQLPAALSGLGRVALAEQDYATARDLLTAALRAEPAADQLNYPLGLAYRGLGDMTKARQHLARRGKRGAYIPDPALDAVMAKKATSQTHVKAGLAAYEAGDLRTAAREYRAALQNNPQLADTHLALAHVLEQLGEFAEATRHCETALELDPSDGKAWHQRGRLHERAGDDEAAARAYEAALERAPEALPPREFLADTLMRLGRYEAATRQYAARLVHGEDAPARVLYLQGLSLIASGSCASAQEPLQRAFAADQTSAEAAEALVRVRSTCAIGNSEQQTGTLSLASELFRALPEADFAEALAMALAASGDFDNAVRLQRRVAESAEATEFSRELLQRFSRKQLADRPWPANAGVYKLPRLGDS